MKKGKDYLIGGAVLLVAFAVFTCLVQMVDVQPKGVKGTSIGFASFNCWFHELTGVNMTVYTITDWLGIVPLLVCIVFAVLGFMQMVRRRSLLKVDRDILLLGIYYIIVVAGYLTFEVIPINYRPILIDGFMEASYPSSTTLLVMSVMPTLVFQINRRVKSLVAGKWIFIMTTTYSAFMIIGRLLCGVHWFTDIMGALMLSMGLFLIYKGGCLWNSTKSCRN